MKKFKYLLLCFGLFLLCGCQADYTLTLTGGNVIEDTNLYENNEKINNMQDDGLTLKEDFDNLRDNPNNALKSANPVADDDDKEYSKSELYTAKTYNQLGNYGVNYNYVFTNSNYEQSNIVNDNVDNFNYSKSSNMIKLDAKNFKCFSNYSSLTNLKVKIITDQTIIYDNADTVNGNEYVWNIDRNNYLEKDIKIYYKIDNNKAAEQTQSNTESTDSTSSANANTNSQDSNKDNLSTSQKYLIILGILLSFGVIIFIIIKVKKNKF